MVAVGKGLLAADESSGSIKKRLDSIGVESTPENRRAYREMLLTSPGIENYISGVILFDETLRDKTSKGIRFPQLLLDKGILPGIKVDTGAKDLAMYPGETVTEGLDTLRERYAEYAEMGAKFAKWRAVINISQDIPTDFAILANAHALARYAALAQEAGIVPVVEPEVLMDGSHDIKRCEEVTGKVLDVTFDQLSKHKIDLTGMILKPNMVIAGMKFSVQADAKEIAEATVRCFMAHVPKEVPGIVFLSGGQSPEESTINLNMINKVKGDAPWELSYSYGRGLQAESLKAWGGKSENVAAAQKAFIDRAKKVSMARMGKYEA